MKRAHFDEMQTALFMVRISGDDVLPELGWHKREGTGAWTKPMGGVTWEILAHEGCVPQVSRTDHHRWMYDIEVVLAEKGEEIEDD